MLVYIVIGVFVAGLAVALLFFLFRPMIGRSSKKTIDRKELRRIEIEYGQKKESDRFKQ
jgi:hypothetical protein